MAKQLAMFVHYTNPASLPPAEHASALMTQGGMRTVLLGIRQGSSIDKLRMTPMAGRRIWTVWAPRSGILLKLHFAIFQVACSVLVLVRRPTVLVANDVLTTPIAAAVLWFSRRTRVIYHEHDMPGPPASAVDRSIGRVRKFVVARAHVTVVPNERRRDLLLATSNAAPSSVQLVWNCPARKDASARREARSQNDHHLRLHYHGSIVPERVPLSVIDALSLMPNLRFRAIGYTTTGSPRWDEALRERAADLGVSERAVIGGPSNRRDIMSAARSADVGWAAIADESADPINLGAMMGASVKVFEYFAAGLPVLVNASDEWADYVVGLGFGIACDPRDPGSIASVLRSLHFSHCRRMGEKARLRIVEEWNYDVQYQPVLDAVLHSAR